MTRSRMPAMLMGIVLCAAWAIGARAEDAAPGTAAAVTKSAPAAKGARSAKAPPASGAKAPKGPKSGKAAKTTAPAEAVSGPEVRNFQAFCDQWMQKLRDRESYNTSHIAWESRAGRVSGEYVGYDTKCGCVAREEPGKDPIGKITYRQTRYRREGATEAEALAAPGTVVEQSDVTEIFRYGKGRWQY